MAFDVQGALKAGYSLDDIAHHVGFNIEGARKAGYSDQQIEQFLANSKPPSETNQTQANMISLPDDSNFQHIDTQGIDGQQINMDTTQTMTPQQLEVSKENSSNHSFAQDTLHAAKQEFYGAMNTLAGLYGSASDVFGSIPVLKDTGIVQDWQQAAKDASEFWKYQAELDNKKEGYGKTSDSFISPYNIGSMIPMLLVPEARISRGAVIAMNGVWAAAMTKGEEPDASLMKQTVDGLLGAALTGVGYKIGDYLLPSYAQKASKALQEKLNISDEEKAKIVKQYREVMQDQPTIKDKLGEKLLNKTDEANPNEEVKAMLYWAGKNRFGIGTKILAQISNDHPDVAINMEKDIIARKNLLKSMADHKYDNLEDMATDLKHIETNIKQDYTNIKTRLNSQKISINPETTNAVNDVLDIPDDLVSTLSDNLRGDMAILKTNLGKPADEVTNGDLIEAYKSVNNLLNSKSAMKTAKGFKLNQVKTMIDQELKKNLTTEDYNLWKQINSNYATMMKVKTSKIGELVNSIIGNTKNGQSMTTNAILAKFPTLVESPETFRAIRDLLGSEKAAKFENFMIDKILDSDDGFNWVRLNNMVGKKGFITPEGQQLQQLIEKFADSFKVDNLYTAELKRLQPEEGSKTMLDDALKAIGVKWLIRSVAKKLPTQSAKEARMIDRITKVLKNPAQVRNINRAMDDMAVTGKQRILQQAFKSLEYKPDITTEIKDSAKYYTSPDGITIKQGFNTRNRLNNAMVEKYMNPNFKNSLNSAKTSDELSKMLMERAKIISKHTGLDTDEIYTIMLNSLGKDCK